jgi:two-component system, LytTR family, sensor kinase
MNPLIQNKGNRYLYILAWIVVSTIQAGFLIIYFKMGILPALIDSLVFNSIFFLLGLIIWYPIRYMPLSKRSIYLIVFDHAALGVLVIISWISLGYFIIKFVFAEQAEIMDSLAISVPYRIISGILMYILILMVYYLIVFSRNLREKMQNESRLNSLVREAELNILKSQINPHFLFNSLNSISSLTLINPENARGMIIKLSDYLRYSLKLSEAEKTLLRDEVDNIRRYLEIEKIRFGKRLNFNLQIDEHSADWPVPNMILQPLFENAVKHGVYESTETVEITMRVDAEAQMLTINIYNNFDPESPGRKGSGIGLRNIKERLKLMYGRDDLLTYQKSETTFSVTVKIPRYEN